VSSPFPPNFVVPAQKPSRSFFRLLASCVAAMLLMGAAPSATRAADSSQLNLPADSSRWAKIGPKRLSQIAEFTAVVPSSAVEFGFQFRAATQSSGYRTKVSVAADGTTSASFSRVKSNHQTGLGSARALGFSVQAGDTIHLEATAVGKKPVILYLRVWKDGTVKPATWQLAVKDRSSRRIAKAGKVYVWAHTPASSPTVTMPFSVQSVALYSAAKAAAVGVDPNQTPAAVGAVGSDETFSIAVIGDTQAETDVASDTRFADRTAWLAANKSSLNLKYVLHTGDVVDWGWLAPAQFTRAKAAMATLTKAGLPFSITIGNHDSRSPGWNNVAGSSGYGGGAYMYNPECPTRLSAAECKSWLLIRKTDEFNTTFPLSSLTSNVGGAYEAGRIDNYWTSFTANNTKWIVITLEFAPRTGVVDWARNVVATHPDSNVIIQTHYYLEGSGNISSSNGGYGNNSGKYIYDQIVSKYPNVKFVLSGHTGSYTSRTDTNNGNTTVSYLGNELGNANNPVRILTINTTTGKVTSTIYNKETSTGATAYKTDNNTITITH